MLRFWCISILQSTLLYLNFTAACKIFGKVSWYTYLWSTFWYVNAAWKWNDFSMNVTAITTQQGSNWLDCCSNMEKENLFSVGSHFCHDVCYMWKLVFFHNTQLHKPMLLCCRLAMHMGWILNLGLTYFHLYTNKRESFLTCWSNSSWETEPIATYDMSIPICLAI